MLPVTYSACFLTLSRTILQSGVAHSGLGPLTLIISQEHALQTCLQVNLMETFSQLIFLLSSYI